jgi:glycerophosphoryl diester phosphodiesterase
MTISVVAHRGDCQFYFENTSQSIIAAIENGIKCIEIDIQLTKDGVPVLYHDRNLTRMTAANSPVAKLNFNEICQLKLLPIEENINKKRDVKISSLQEIVELVQRYPEVTLFAEVKRVNFLSFSYRVVYQQIFKLLKPILTRVVVISFSYRFLRLCQQKSAQAIAYVLPTWQSYSAKMLTKLQPQYIFCNEELVPRDHLFSELHFSNHKAVWVLYEVAELTKVQEFHRRGVKYFETFFPVKLKAELLAAGMECNQ